eukprot:6207526-Pleurochrysis_carterae.AAC.1
MRSHGVGCVSRPGGGEHDRRGEAASRMYNKESMKVTTHSAEAWTEMSDRESSKAKGAKRRSPPSRGERACMMPAVNAAARKTTLVTSDTTGQLCNKVGVAIGAGVSDLSSAASHSGSTLVGGSRVSTGC